jgi:hypothetical protein
MKALRKGGLSVSSLVSIVLLLGGCGHNTQASGDPNNPNSKPGLLARIFELWLLPFGNGTSHLAARSKVWPGFDRSTPL